MSDLKTLKDFLRQQTLMNGPIGMDPIFQHLLFRKTDYPLLSTDFFTTVYGAKVWDALDQQTRFWNLLRKVPWGPRTGWRNRSARNTSTVGISENGDLPAVAKSTISNIYGNPKIVTTMLGVTALGQFLSGLEGGIGDALAEEQEGAKNDHVKFINESLLNLGHVVCTTSGASLTAVAAPYGTLHVGDTVYGTGAGGADTYTIISHDATTGVVGFTASGSGGNWVDGNNYVVKSRLGPTSLDEIVEADGRTMEGANTDDVDCYNLTTRTAGTYAAGIVLDNAGTAREITLPLLDQAIRSVRDIGGEPDLILTGTEQVDNIASLLQAQQRFMGVGEFKVKVGSETTLPGQKAGFEVSTYKGIPVFGDPDCAKGCTEAGVAVGSNVYVLDTRFIEIAVAQMTQYLESKDFLQNGKMLIKALFWTMFELRCTDISKQCKITDLSATV